MSLCATLNGQNIITTTLREEEGSRTLGAASVPVSRGQAWGMPGDCAATSAWC